MKAVFSNRDFTDKMPTGFQTYPVRWSWDAVGGALEAEIEISGGWVEGELRNYLRCPVTIYSDFNVPIWWGFVNSVEIGYPIYGVSVSLDNMYNEVAVLYSYVATGSQEVGARKTTTAATDTTSQALYGTKSLRLSVGGASDAQATATRDATLAQFKKPIRLVSPRGEGTNQTAKFLCKGWFQSLGWKYYANTGTTSVETTTQISAVVTAAGQFLTSTVVIDASGINSSEYRDGEANALTCITDLLKSGVSGGRRLYAYVDQNRRLLVYQEPAETIKYYLRNDGLLADTLGVRLPFGQLVTGWCKAQNVLPDAAAISLFADPSMFFIERAEWDEVSQRLMLTPKGSPAPYDLYSELS